MPRPDLISQEYITPSSVTNFFSGSRNTTSVRTERTYSNLRPKPLSCRRRRFIGTNVGFVVAHLCAMLTLVLYMTIRPGQRRYAASQGCELCDLWCTSNCSQLTRDGDEGLTRMVINVNESKGKDKGLCCVKRRDWLSTNYEYLQKQKSTTAGNDFPRKILDGIRLKDKWTEDSNWKRWSPSVLTFDKKNKRFTVSADGTFSVYSRIDFRCLNEKSFNQQKLAIGSRTGVDSVFVDERAQLGQSKSTLNGTVIYTSTVNVIVSLQKGDSLKFLTDPSTCALPRTLVVFQSTYDVDL